MSPDNPLNTATLLPEATAPQPSPSSAETTAMDPARVVSTYADTLMGSLFGDLERLLDGDDNALAAVEAELQAPPSPAETALQPLLPQEALAPEPDLALANTDTALVPAVEPPSAPPAPTKTLLGLWIDRLLLACTAFSLAGVVVLLWMGQRPDATMSSNPSTDGAASLVGQSDAEFLAYLQRSLDAIEKQVTQAQTEASSTQAPFPNTALLPPGGPLPPSQGSGLGLPGRINVIERVYIPYQATPPALPTTPPASTIPPAAGTLPAIPVVPSPGSVTTPSQPAAPVVNHVLVGVLELGDRSAALFEINGVSQRVYIGERIGNAGWSLVSVSNQEVVIRRNGEVRSIYIGQQF